MTTHHDTDPKNLHALRRKLRRALRRRSALVVACVIAAAGIGLRLHAQNAGRSTGPKSRRSRRSMSSRRKPARRTQRAGAARHAAAPIIDAPIYARVNGYLKRWYVDIGAPGQGRPGAGRHRDAGARPADPPGRSRSGDRASANDAARARSPPSAGTRCWPRSRSRSRRPTRRRRPMRSARRWSTPAQANLARLKAMAAFKHVVAPFDGIVTARNTDVGNLINAGAGGKGSELFRVADEHEARVYVDVPQTDAGADASRARRRSWSCRRSRASWCRPGWRIFRRLSASPRAPCRSS